MNLLDEFREKVDRVRSLLQREALAGVLLKRQANFSWITCGGHNDVSMASDIAHAAVLVTPSRAILITSNIEAPRLIDEEIKKLSSEIEVEEWQWNERSDFEVANAIMQGKKWGSDVACRSARAVTNQVTAIRPPLTATEITRYRALGKDVAAILSQIGASLKPGLTEAEVTGRLAEAFLAQGATPAVLLVAADDRIKKYRHPVAKNAKIKKRVMLVVNVKRHGLYAAATRVVCFGKPPATVAKRHAACCRIEARAMAAAAPDLPLGKLFQAIVDGYAAEGFEDEWRLHHQGGPIGYDGRDLILSVPGLKAPVIEGQTFALNPSITGAKSEDTFLVKVRGIDILTASKDWPMIPCETEIGVIERPDMLAL